MSGIDGTEEPEGKCAEALTVMYLFLDKEQLSDAERAHVKEHLDECIPCLESFEFEAELKQVIKKKCTDDMPSALYEKVKSSIHMEVIAQSAKPSQPPSA